MKDGRWNGDRIPGEVNMSWRRRHTILKVTTISHELQKRNFRLNKHSQSSHFNIHDSTLRHKQSEHLSTLTMVLLSTIGLIAALAAPALSLPNNPNFQRQVESISIDPASITTPDLPSPTSPAAYESSSVVIEDGELNQCANVLCEEDTTCEVVDGTAVCVPGTKCGPSVCGPGLVCCNESCGICTPPDGGCIMLWCGPVEKA